MCHREHDAATAGPLAQVADTLTAQQAGKRRFPTMCTADD